MVAVIGDSQFTGTMNEGEEDASAIVTSDFVRVKKRKRLFTVD